jgi:hypothetical protein
LSDGIGRFVQDRQTYGESDVFGFEAGDEHRLSAEAVSDCTVISYRHRGAEGLAANNDALSRLERDTLSRLREMTITGINPAEEPWRNGMLPQGILERGFFDDGTLVTAGERIAEARIESALHEIMSPSKGVLVIMAEENAVVEPGTRVARLVAWRFDARTLNNQIWSNSWTRHSSRPHRNQSAPMARRARR